MHIIEDAIVAVAVIAVLWAWEAVATRLRARRAQRPSTTARIPPLPAWLSDRPLTDVERAQLVQHLTRIGANIDTPYDVDELHRTNNALLETRTPDAQVRELMIGTANTVANAVGALSLYAPSDATNPREWAAQTLVSSATMDLDLKAMSELP